ncbi:MAG: carbonic anhydrase [Geminicoccaceae bacterium]
MRLAIIALVLNIPLLDRGVTPLHQSDTRRITGKISRTTGDKLMTETLVPETLLTGYRRFMAGRYADQKAIYDRLAEGQRPATMIIGCADSRVDPATIFAADPGKLFIVRNVANLIPPPERDGAHHGTSAALEFAVTALEVRQIVVMGHGQCGGIKAALAAAEGSKPSDFLAPWVSLIDRARDEVLAELGDADDATKQVALEHRSIGHSLETLMAFDFVAERVEAGTLSLHGAWFAIKDGALHWRDPETGEFATVDPVPR